MPERSREIVVVAHCHLNVNTKIQGPVDYSGVRAEVIAPLIAEGVGIVQLPCPEATYLGMKRWGMTVEQYDTPSYRRHCRAILSPVLDTLAALAADGCVIRTVLGVEGSPSCGVDTTCTGFTGGEVDESALAQSAVSARGSGVFMDELRAILGETGLVDVALSGVAD
jgi:predicted secreted protein